MFTRFSAFLGEVQDLSKYFPYEADWSYFRFISPVDGFEMLAPSSAPRTWSTPSVNKSWPPLTGRMAHFAAGNLTDGGLTQLTEPREMQQNLHVSNVRLDDTLDEINYCMQQCYWKRT